MIHILATQYNPAHEALEIYMSGCKQNCPGCHNPETHGFGQGQRWERWMKDNSYKLKNTNGLFRRVWVMGGEPLDQNPVDLREFLYSLHRANPELELWLWTSKELTDVPEPLLKHISIVKTGRYLQGQPEGTTVHYAADSPALTLASSNQQIHKV